MTKAVVSDTTGKVIKYDLCYSLKIKSLGNGVTLPIDTEMNKELMNLIKLGLQNDCKWSIWNNDARSYEAAPDTKLPNLDQFS